MEDDDASIVSYPDTASGDEEAVQAVDEEALIEMEAIVVTMAERDILVVEGFKTTPAEDIAAAAAEAAESDAAAYAELREPRIWVGKAEM